MNSTVRTPPPRGQAKQALIEAAAALAREEGLAGLSVDRVVKRAAISKGAFFHHFATRNDLVTALIAHLAEAFEADLAGREASGELFARALVGATLDEVERNTGFMATLVSAVVLHRALGPVIEARTEVWTQRMIADGMDESRARLVRAALDGLLLQCLLRRNERHDEGHLRVLRAAFSELLDGT